MATYLTVTATHDGSVDNQPLRAALRGIGAEDISVSSPVTSPAGLSTARDDVEPEAEAEEPTYRWVIRTGDRDAEFTRRTTAAIVGAVSSLDGVTDVEVDGGYESPEDDADESESEDGGDVDAGGDNEE